MLEVKIDKRRCTGCGKCEHTCPKGPRIFELVEGKGKLKAVVLDSTFCLECGMCVTVCPTSAVKLI